MPVDEAEALADDDDDEGDDVVDVGDLPEGGWEGGVDPSLWTVVVTVLPPLEPFDPSEVGDVVGLGLELLVACFCCCC